MGHIAAIRTLPTATAGLGLGAEDWYARGVALETADPEHAAAAYRRALAVRPEHPDAHVNLGRLQHEAGRVEAAERHYRRALAQRPDDAIAAFNLGVALQDLGRPRAAAEAYRQAIALDPADADPYFNLAGLCQKLGRVAAAIRNLQRYRQLTAPPGRR